MLIKTNINEFYMYTNILTIFSSIKTYFSRINSDIVNSIIDLLLTKEDTSANTKQNETIGTEILKDGLLVLILFID